MEPISDTGGAIAEGRIPVPVVVQHTRLDSRQAENALITTVAFPAG